MERIQSPLEVDGLNGSHPYVTGDGGDAPDASVSLCRVIFSFGVYGCDDGADALPPPKMPKY
jgi:hypothetical protein